MSETSVYSLISSVVADTDLTDPREIARIVAEATPEEAVRQFFEDGLVAEVRNVLAQQRNRAMDNAMKPRSPKLQQRRDWWAEMCAARIHVGDSRWMSLGDCTATELRYAADERRRDAERELKRAESYDQLRSLLRSHKVRTVAELPADAARAAALVVAA